MSVLERLFISRPAPSEVRAATLLEYSLRVHGMPRPGVRQIEPWKPGLEQIFDFRRQAVARLLV